MATNITSLPHGVTTVSQAPEPTGVVNLDNEILAIVGSAPIHLATEPLIGLALIKSRTEFKSLFGDRNDNYDLSVFDSILRDYGVGPYFAVNVFDPDTHTGTVALSTSFSEAISIRLENVVNGSNIVVSTVTVTAPASQTMTETDGVFSYDTGESAIDAVIVSQDGETFELGRDYTVDAGIITLVGDRIDGESPVDIGFTAADIPLTLDTDYEVEEIQVENQDGETYSSLSGYGYSDWLITGIGTTGAGDDVFITYTAASPEYVPNSAILAGLDQIKETQGTYGFTPTHLTSQKFDDPIVINAVEILADKLSCQYHATIPKHATVEEAIAGRTGTDGRVKNAVTNSSNALLYSEWLRYPDASGNGFIFVPQHWHGMAARWAVSRRRGFWWSISSYPMVNGLGILTKRILSREDETADNQRLIAAGYITTYSEFGPGIVFDGNFNAAHPSRTDGLHFAAVANARATVLRSVKSATLRSLDTPSNRASATSLKREISEYLEDLSDENRNRGQALGGGSVEIDILQISDTLNQQLGILPNPSGSDRRQGEVKVFLSVTYLAPTNVVVISDTVSASV